MEQKFDLDKICYTQKNSKINTKTWKEMSVVASEKGQ